MNLRQILALLLIGICMNAIGQQREVPKPSPMLMPNAAQGERLYVKNCAACHGADLKGSDKGPPFLHPVYEPSHHGDASFQMAVKYGVRAHHWKFGDMKAVEGLSPDHVAHITEFIRKSQRQVGIK
jgi:cytochrome c2